MSGSRELRFHKTIDGVDNPLRVCLSGTGYRAAHVNVDDMKWAFAFEVSDGLSVGGSDLFEA